MVVNAETLFYPDTISVWGVVQYFNSKNSDLVTLFSPDSKVSLHPLPGPAGLLCSVPLATDLRQLLPGYCPSAGGHAAQGTVLPPCILHFSTLPCAVLRHPAQSRLTLAASC